MNILVTQNESKKKTDGIRTFFHANKKKVFD